MASASSQNRALLVLVVMIAFLLVIFLILNSSSAKQSPRGNQSPSGNLSNLGNGTASMKYCGSISEPLAPNALPIGNASSAANCFVNAYGSFQNANLKVTFFGVDTGTTYNLTTSTVSGVDTEGHAISVSESYYSAPRPATPGPVFSCATLGAYTNSTTGINGIDLSGCTNSSTIYIALNRS